MEKISNISIYAPYLFMTEAEFQHFRGVFKPKNSMITGDPSKFILILDVKETLSNIRRLVDVIFQTTHDAILRNDEELNPQTLRTLLRDISLQSKVSHGDLMYALRAALTGMTVRFFPTTSRQCALTF